MFEDNTKTDSFLGSVKRFIPGFIFRPFQPLYHRILSAVGALVYGFPGREMTIIGVTGTKGKSTTVYMIAHALEEQGVPVAAIGSLGFKIKEKEWPNNLHMTMPGRMKLQKFLRTAKNAGVTHVVLEATSEGMAQGRLFGVPIDSAVVINIHPEHIERHGGLRNYITAKQMLFKKASNFHIVNAEDKYVDEFSNFKCSKIIGFGLETGDVTNEEFDFKLKIKGDFNIYNALAAMAVMSAYGFDIEKTKKSIEDIEMIAGRMEYVDEGQKFDFIVDYAHTPESLEAVYKYLEKSDGKLICILGSDGGGRDTWKRPKMGEIASTYCDEVILTSENPYDTDPNEIADEIEGGMKKNDSMVVKRVIDRKDAMVQAVRDVNEGDTVVITGKGTEDSIVIANGKKIPWLDSKKAREAITESRR